MTLLRTSNNYYPQPLIGGVQNDGNLFNQVPGQKVVKLHLIAFLRTGTVRVAILYKNTAKTGLKSRKKETKQKASKTDCNYWKKI